MFVFAFIPPPTSIKLPVRRENAHISDRRRVLGGRVFGGLASGLPSGRLDRRRRVRLNLGRLRGHVGYVCGRGLRRFFRRGRPELKLTSRWHPALVRVDLGRAPSTGPLLPILLPLCLHQDVSEKPQSRLLTARPQDSFQSGYPGFIAFHQNLFSIFRSNAWMR